MATQAEKNAVAANIRQHNDLIEEYRREGITGPDLDGLIADRDALMDYFDSMVVTDQVTPTPTPTPTPPIIPPSGPPADWIRPPGWPADWPDDVVWAAIQTGSEPPIEDVLPLPGEELPGDILGGDDMTMQGAPAYRGMAGDIYTAPELYRYAMGMPQVEGRALNPWQQYLMGWQRPTQSMWELESAMAQPGATLPGATMPSAYGDYAGGAVTNRYQRSQQLLNQLLGMRPEAREERGLAYGMGGYGMPSPFAGQDVGIDYANLLQMALRPQLGRMGGAMMARRVEPEQEAWTRRYMASQAAGQPAGPSFLDYFTGKYGLGGYLGA